MKHTKKLASLLLTLVMVLSMGITAFAQKVDAEKGGSATITINNASKGETYEVYKIFDATYNNDTGAIAYTYNGTLPANSYFVQDANTGAITATDAAKDSEGFLNKAATDWVMNNLKGDPVASAEADGSKLTFTGLEYGYYLVTSTHGTLVAVNSTQPDAVMNDKNYEVPFWDPEGGKTIVTDGSTTADIDEANIGDTVNFRLSIITQNFTKENDNPIAYYTIGDNFPDGLDLIAINSVTVDRTPVDYTPTGNGFPITIKWADENGNSLYNTDANLVVNYTARLNDNAVIDGDGNENTATFTYGYYNPENPDDPTPGKETEEDSAKVYTYALGFKKVSDEGTALAGAKFQLPFYVKEAPAADGAYIYAGIEEGEGLTNTLTTTDTGLIVIKGVEPGDYEFSEIKAPDGYNKLDGPFTVPAARTGSSTTTTVITRYLDEDGNVTDVESDIRVTYEEGNISITDLGVVVNKTGALLPATGGIGTTIFYVIGAILMIGAGVMLVTRKRMSK
ncbi:isopeptide-forming domain-containing fimbrial protein [Roseburia hominis]